MNLIKIIYNDKGPEFKTCDQHPFFFIFDGNLDLKIHTKRIVITQFRISDKLNDLKSKKF